MKTKSITTLALMAVLCLTANSTSAQAKLVIAEVYGGGGNTGATYQNDYVVIFNSGDTAQDVNGWSVQYQTQAGTTWAVIPLANATIQPGAYHLVQLFGGATGAALPTPDTTGTVNLNASQAKVALINSTTALSGQCPGDSSVIDKVGYGSTATTCSETANTSSPANNATSMQRQDGGCQDTDDNSVDFFLASPNPRNSSSPTHLCSGDLSITAQPQSRTNNAGTTATFSVTANGAIGFLWNKVGVGPLSNGGKISGADSSILSIRTVLNEDEGDYFVTVQGSSANSNSVNAHLTVNDPAINTQPVNTVNVAGDTADLYATVVGTSPVDFRWYQNNAFVPIGIATINDPTNVISADLVNSQPGDEGNYFLVASNAFGMVTSSVASVTIFPTPSTRLARWDFNFYSVSPSEGGGLLSFISALEVEFTDGSFSDPAEVDEPLFNFGLSTARYPSTSTSNKLAGVQFNVGTEGYKNILLTWHQRNSAAASKYLRVQYSADGFNTTTNDHDVITVLDTNLNYVFYSSDLTGIAAANDNPNFAFRLVTEFESTATGSGADGYVGTVSTYNTGGTVRYDLMSVYGSTLGEVTSIPLTIQRVGTNVVLSWSDPAFSLQAAPLVTGTYTNIPGVVGSPHTNPVTGGQNYFRLIANP